MLSPGEIRARLTSAQAQDRLAAIEHERWSLWERYLHDQCERRDDGSLIIPADLVDHWKQHMSIPCASLSPDEQRSDLEQVESHLPASMDLLR